MQYELTEEEIRHIEAYRDLTEKFQAAIDEQMKVMFKLQTSIFIELINGK